MKYDVVVIGGGPCGITAAMYAARAGKSVMLLEQNAFGGQIANAPRVENYPSVNEINGAQLADKMFQQAVNHGVEFDMGKATFTRNAATGDFTVTTEYATFQCAAVVLATGARFKRLTAQNADKLDGKGVCYCAVCDGAFYSGKPVCVVGDGNSAAQYALYLADVCSEVRLLTLTDRLFCDNELMQRIVSNDKVEWIPNVTVTEVFGTDQVEGVVYCDNDGAISYLDTSAVFVAIGQQPSNDAFKDLVQLDANGYVIAGEDCKTTCPGVFAAGDCRTKSVRQCATAVGDGAVAGFNAAMYVDSLKR